MNAQTIIAGQVLEDSTNQALGNVEVILEGSVLQTRTTSSGWFSIRVAPGRHVLLFRHIGYLARREGVQVRGEDTVWLSPTMVRAPFELPEVNTEVEQKRARGSGLEAFDERRKMGFGSFIDSSVLRHSEHLHVTDVLRRHSRVGLNQNAYAYTYRKAGVGFGTCYMQVILDGRVLYYSGQTKPLGVPRDQILVDLRREIQVSELAAIEIYYGPAGTPAEFNGAGAACGTIVMWTKRP